MTGFKVTIDKCNECLFSLNKIVSNARRKQILERCLRLGHETFFECHKGTLAGVHICCKGFFDVYGDRVTIIQIGQRLGYISFIDVETLDQPGLPAGESEANP